MNILISALVNILIRDTRCVEPAAGTAKSQFLKYVEKVAHRAVYTTGEMPQPAADQLGRNCLLLLLLVTVVSLNCWWS